MRKCVKISALFFLLMATGCAPALIAGGAAGGYKAATDERSLGRMWDDAAITTRVNTGLIKDPVVKSRKIDVDTLEGVVLLTGVVETAAESKRAFKIARKVPGVRKVKNQLQIGSKSLGQSVDDHVIGGRIKAKLFIEPGIRSLNIDVDVVKGVVYLTGLVEHQKQKKRALEIARSTEGTVRVVDNLDVKSP